MFTLPVTNERIHIITGWLLIGIMVVGAVESFLTRSLLWSGFTLLLVAVAVLPALATQNVRAIVPWPLLFAAAVAVIARATNFYVETAGYLAIATLALVVVVELDMFTPVELGRRFAVAFGVLTTMAIEALWIIAQFVSDLWLGSDFLTTQTELQEDIVIVTVMGFVVGGLFYWYFTHVEPFRSEDRSEDSAKP